MDHAFYSNHNLSAVKFRIYSSFAATVPPRWPNAGANGYSPMSAKNDKPGASSSELVVSEEALQDPVHRRSWLLAKALESHSLDEALELARAAEAFITGALSTATAAPSPGSCVEDAAAQPPPNQEGKPPRRTVGLALPPEQREQLLERLAEGARNAELARQFGLSMRQVQGIRMGSAREIARRREAAQREE